jgi:hypothetical protein
MTCEILNAFRGDILSETTITGDYQLRESRVRTEMPRQAASIGSGSPEIPMIPLGSSSVSASVRLAAGKSRILRPKSSLKSGS